MRQLTVCVQVVLGGGMLLKYHENLLWSPLSLRISLWIANTCHQLLIRLLASTRFYSTLGNIETHPGAPLLKQRLHVQDNGSRTGATSVFLGKSPHLDGRGGGGGISEDLFSTANVDVRKVETVFALSSRCHFGVAKPFPISEHKAHVLSTQCTAALLFSLNQKGLWQEAWSWRRNPGVEVINLRNTRTVFPWLVKIYIYTQHTYNYVI